MAKMSLEASALCLTEGVQVMQLKLSSPAFNLSQGKEYL